MKMTEQKQTELLRQAYHWGRDNGSNKSEKNFNDFLQEEAVQQALSTTDVITRLSDEQIDDLIYELDEYGREYDHYEYGLPTHDKHMDNLRNIVKAKLNAS